MDVWIETAAGNLFRASHTDRIAVIKTSSGNWEVSIGAGAANAVFAPGITDEVTAKRVRSGLAMGLHKAAAKSTPQVLAFSGTTKSVTLSDLAG